MTTIKQIGILGAVWASSLLVSCTKDFEKINTDPDNIEKVSPGTLMNPILYEMSSFGAERGEGFTMDIMQVRLPWPSSTGGVHRYVLTENAGNSTWNTYYKWLGNIREVELAANIAGANRGNYRAIALTMKAWAGAMLTDCFGDIPFSEAVQGENGVFKPVFDTQKEIYTQMLKDLDTANALFNPGDKLVYGTEMLYNNDVAKWQRFCNSLHLRLLLRVSNKPEMNAAAKMKEILADGVKYPIFTSNDQSAIYKITGITPNISPWSRAQDFVNFRCASEFFVNTLNDLEDPRRAKWLTQATSIETVPQPIGYKGVPSGYTGNESQFNFNPSNMVTALGVAPTMQAVIMTYAEVEFIKAELAQKGVIAGDAKQFYENGVKASVEQWGATLPATYFDNPKAQYDNTLARIMLQKYVALFFTDYQQWFEYRRTKLPVLPVGEGMLNDKVMPVRFKYPSTVQTTNYDNYKAAVTSMGGDDINTKVWWEK